MEFQPLSQEDPLEEAMATVLQCAYLENPMDRGTWQATVHGVAKSPTRQSTRAHLNCRKTEQKRRHIKSLKAGNKSSWYLSRPPR